MKYIKTTTTNEKRIFDSEKLASEIYDYITNYYVGMQLSDEAEKWYEVFSNSGVLETLKKEFEAEDFDNVGDLFYEYGNEDWLLCGKISDSFEDFYLKFIEKFNILHFGSGSPMENAEDEIEYYIRSNKSLAEYDKWRVSLTTDGEEIIVDSLNDDSGYYTCYFSNDEDGFECLKDFFSNCKKYDLPMNTPMYELYSNLINSAMAEYVTIEGNNMIGFDADNDRIICCYVSEKDEFCFISRDYEMEFNIKNTTAFDVFAQFYASYIITTGESEE